MRLSVHTDHRVFFAVMAGGYLLLVLLCAILPARALEKRYPPTDERPSDLVERGRQLYRAYGCITCHTQQIRGDERLAEEAEDGTLVVPVLGADLRFGVESPSTAAEYRNDDPPFLGTQRTGPDLLAVGTRLPSPEWHFWHLYDPRSVSPGSVMPGLPWLFRTEETKQDGDEKVDPLFDLDVPKGRLYATPEAQALVEYLLSRTREASTR
mgnify:CR=1 FL=1